MKKLLSLILTIVMLVGIIPALPITVSAETDSSSLYTSPGEAMPPTEEPPAIVLAPIVSPASCEFDDSIDITLSCETPGANIYYSYSFPNQDIEVPAVMWLYTEPIHFTYTTNLSVYAEKGGVRSEWVRATYTNRNEFPTDPPIPETTPVCSSQAPTAEPTEAPITGTYGPFTYVIVNEEATITGYNTALGEPMDIPSTLGGYPVTAIGERAFSGRSITNVTFPASLTFIGDNAFAGCQLRSVTIPESVTFIGESAFSENLTLSEIIVDEDNPSYCSEDGVLFNKSKTVLMQYPPTKPDTEQYVVPGSVTTIDPYAFSYSLRLTSIFLPSVRSIGKAAFRFCENLVSVSLSNTITEIKEETFRQCIELEDIYIPRSVTLIEEYAFLACPSLAHITYTGDEAMWTYITIESGNDALERAEVHHLISIPSEPPVTEEPTEEPTYPPQIYEIPAPRVSVESGVVPYGTVVRISPVDGHFSYYINGESYYSYDFYEDITIYEDTVLRVVSWKDVMDPNITYIGGEATYTYTVDPATIPSDDTTAEPTTPPTEPPVTEEPTEEPTEPPVTEEPTAPPTEEPTAPPTAEPTAAPTGELSVSKSSVSVKVGKSVSVSAYLGDTDITDLATWNSKKDSIATVENGTITGVKAGTTKVSVSYGDQIKQIEVEVKTSGGGGGGGGGSVRPTAAPTTAPTEVPTQAPIQSSVPFKDVSENDWYFDAVSFAYESGLMNGVAEEEFSPESTITRAMFVTVLYRMAGEPTAQGALPFMDISAESYYEKAVLWATENGIVSGISETSFAPDMEISREQMATMIYRYVKSCGQGFTGLWMFPLDFEDSANVSEYAYEALAWCTMNGIINGMDDNTLRPADDASRAQAAAIFMRTFNTLSK